MLAIVTTVFIVDVAPHALENIDVKDLYNNPWSIHLCNVATFINGTKIVDSYDVDGRLPAGVHKIGESNANSLNTDHNLVIMNRSEFGRTWDWSIVSEKIAALKEKQEEKLYIAVGRAYGDSDDTALLIKGTLESAKNIAINTLYDCDDSCDPEESRVILSHCMDINSMFIYSKKNSDDKAPQFRYLLDC